VCVHCVCGVWVLERERARERESERDVGISAKRQQPSHEDEKCAAEGARIAADALLLQQQVICPWLRT
jgi:hypothetical protein